MAEETSFIEAPAGVPTEVQAGIKPIGEIKVSELTPAAAAPAAPTKKGSVKESIFADLRKKFGAPEDQPAAAAPAAVDKPKDNPDEVEDDEAAQAAAAKPVEGAKPADKKLSPWKVVEQVKAEKKALEEKLLQYEKQGVPPEKVKPFEDKIAELSKRNEELEQEIRFTSYQKSKEFQEKYQKPYEDTWKRAMTELSEVTVIGDDGSERPISATDILDLVNLPLRDAKALAEERFGDFAPEVMQHRKEIRRQVDEQAAAIEENKKAGADWQKKSEEQRLASTKELHQQTQKIWAEANEKAASDPKHGKYFKPIEGDQEGNQRLSKGFELADRAFSENPLYAKTPEERRAIVERHAAVRNRCAAYGRLVYQNEKYSARVAELEAKLKEYGDTEPSRAPGARPAATVAAKVSAKDSIFAELRKRAK